MEDGGEEGEGGDGDDSGDYVGSRQQRAAQAAYAAAGSSGGSGAAEESKEGGGEGAGGGAGGGTGGECACEIVSVSSVRYMNTAYCAVFFGFYFFYFGIVLHWYRSNPFNKSIATNANSVNPSPIFMNFILLYFAPLQYSLITLILSRGYIPNLQPRSPKRPPLLPPRPPPP